MTARRGVLAAIVAAAATTAAAGPVSVTITKVRCVDDCDAAGLEAALESTADFYAKVWIDGAETITPREPDDQTEVRPYWVVSRTIPDAQPAFAVAIQIWDHDSTSGDDLGDTSPLGGGDNNLDLVVDAATGRWSGDIAWPQNCATGSGGDEPRVEVCFDVSVDSLSGDLDGDGLLDGWERNGLDADADGTIDVDLPAMRAKVGRRDMFLELDTEAGRQPTRASLQSVKNAFAAAPLPNPDGSTGISLWIDAGPVRDPFPREAAAPADCQDGVDNDGDLAIDGADTGCAATVTAAGRTFRPYLDTASEAAPPPTTSDCADGADNDGDGLADAADPECVATIADDFGGGGAIPAVGACDHDAAFVAAKAANFNPLRAQVFRYAVSGARGAGCPPPPNGGEADGPEFVDFNNDGGTVMHELGHTLGLEHGGTDASNCKPNYISVMNYDRQFGITRVLGGAIVDFSPPRLALGAGARAAGPLGTLVESALDEALPLDATDGVNQYVFSTGVDAVTPRAANAAPDWLNDGPPFQASVVANVNQGGLASCDNTMSNETLAGAVDWPAIRLPIRLVGGAGGAPAPLRPPEPTIDELVALDAAINTTDLSIAAVDGPDPAAAGAAYTLTLTAANDGPNPATSVELTATLPPEASHALSPGPCALAGTALRCNFGTVPPGEARAVTVRSVTPPDLVYLAGAPVTLTTTAEVRNLAGPEAAAADNALVETTVVRAEADLATAAFSPPNPPFTARVGETFVVALDTVITNGGPSSPMDVVLDLEAEADPGATVTPTRLSTSQRRLSTGEARAVRDHLLVRCSRSGAHAVRARHAIRPIMAADVGLVPANDAAATGFEFVCDAAAREVRINFWPGRFPNVLRLGDQEAPVAVMTTREGEYGLPAFDAASVVVGSLAVGPEALIGDPGLGVPMRPGSEQLADAAEPVPPEQTLDGDDDLGFWFDPSAARLGPGDRRLCVTGLYRDAGGAGQAFFGCDDVVVER